MKWTWLASALCISMLGSAPKGLGTIPPDHQHDFDFEFGAWKAQLRIRQRLSNENTWTELNGTSVVHKIWEGKANVGELEVGNDKMHLDGLTMRFYSPQTQQWNIYWSNAKDGAINGTPMFGNFNNGRGEFYGTDTSNGASIYARFVFSDLTPTSFTLEQSFSADGGKTWVTNWMATFTR
jgi:hypothetical protein